MKQTDKHVQVLVFIYPSENTGIIIPGCPNIQYHVQLTLDCVISDLGLVKLCRLRDLGLGEQGNFQASVSLIMKMTNEFSQQRNMLTFLQRICCQ